jgi:DNA-binding NtrC family response regulator
MAHATTKTIELASPKTTLTPCILDDDPAQLDLMTEQVAILGYEAIPTSNPEEALRLIRTRRCRMVFADVHMPGMNGYEFLDQALRSDPGVHVIVMTGSYTLDSALDAIRRGATDFLPKPIDRAHEANLGRTSGVVRPASARKSAGRATLEGFGISRNRRQEPCHAGGF